MIRLLTVAVLLSKRIRKSREPQLLMKTKK
jgi:hypothetical protein